MKTRPHSRASSRSIRASATSGAALLLAACGNGLEPVGPTLALGTWGGDEAGVIVSEAGAHVHIGCTFGDLDGQVELDLEGRFAVDGRYVLRAFPVVVGPELPARFSGRVVGRRLTLAVAVNDTVEGRVVALGPVEVELGREPAMQNCPICSVPGERGPIRDDTPP